MIQSFWIRYSAWTHTLLLGWNSIAAFYVASAEFRTEVSGLQHALHLPGWALVLFTGLVNITASYRDWQKKR